jgi:hypothetical protein
VTASSAARDFGLVQWGEAGQVAQPLPHRVVDPHRTGEAGSAVHDTMTDHIRFVPVTQDFGEAGWVEPICSGR